MKITDSLGILALLILFGCNPPDAEFEANNTSPMVGDHITLRDQSANDPDTWEWNVEPPDFQFEMGTGSVSQNPVLSFTEAGVYSVSLTVSNSSGSATESKADYITVSNNHSPVVLVHSSGLEGNLLGDSPDREVRIYLPPDYFENTGRHYPVVYLLHGYYADHNFWFEGMEIEDIHINIEEILNTLIGENQIEPMIVAAPNAKNKYFGSLYSNSSTSGKWEDFITRDVVGYIDFHFRTIPSRESRGIGGASMGGMGAFRIAMKHPGLFGVLYSHSAGVLAFEDYYLEVVKEDLVTASQLDAFGPSDFFSYPAAVGACVACAPAYAPNPETLPFYGDFPVTAEGDLVDSTWQRWLEHDPLTLLDTYKDNLQQVAILFNCGSTDEFAPGNHIFEKKLTQLGIIHSFEIYEGGHADMLAPGFESFGFPFFSEHLVHE